jgi:hypothetical protein
VRYRIEAKAFPPKQNAGVTPTPSVPTPPTPAPAAAPAPDSPQPPVDDARQWSGDPYEEGDETDPTQAYSSGKTADGTEAWLDRHTDGTLVGWVRAPDGKVYRYSDPDAWSIDVDDAGITQTTKGDAAPAPADGSPDAPDAAAVSAGTAPPDPGTLFTLDEPSGKAK